MAVLGKGEPIHPGKKEVVIPTLSLFSLMCYFLLILQVHFPSVMCDTVIFATELLKLLKFPK